MFFFLVKVKMKIQVSAFLYVRPQAEEMKKRDETVWVWSKRNHLFEIDREVEGEGLYFMGDASRYMQCGTGDGWTLRSRQQLKESKQSGPGAHKPIMPSFRCGKERLVQPNLQSKTDSRGETGTWRGTWSPPSSAYWMIAGKLHSSYICRT